MFFDRKAEHFLPVVRKLRVIPASVDMKGLCGFDTLLEFFDKHMTGIFGGSAKIGHLLEIVHGGKLLEEKA